MKPGYSRQPSQERIRFIGASAADPLANDGPNVVANLCRVPKRISSVYVYDDLGTELFELQCATPEYYLRRVETRLLRSHAREIVDVCGAIPIVELGAGTCAKTRLLLAEYARRGVRCEYFPIDVDTGTLDAAAQRLTTEFPRLLVQAVGASYREGLVVAKSMLSRKLLLFLGSSIGNMDRPELDALLDALSSNSSSGDHLVIGADLHKDTILIDRAYNDSAGLGARSSLNALSHLNRRYQGDFSLERFRYRSRYDPRIRCNEVRFESLVDQTVTLRQLEFSVFFAAGELVDAEVMRKFDPDELSAQLLAAGFEEICRWIEPTYRYGLFLFRRFAQ